MSSLKRNLGYQTIYQIISTALPLITSPYLSRVLGASKLGVFSFTQSIVGYFLLLSALGTVNYGTRTIASCKHDKELLSKNFFEIFIFQCLTSIVSLGLYSLYILFICKDNLIIAICQGVLLFGSLLDINWLFFGIENFKVTVTRNIIIRISTVVLILLLVKSPNDLWVYTLLMSAGTFFSNAVLFYFVPRVVKLSAVKNVSIKGIIKHIKPNLVLFIPLLAMSVFHIMDKTMLGALSTYEQTGFYYNADKVINIPIGIITGIGTVMLPRATTMIENGKVKESDDLFNFTVEMIIAVSSAMAFGIAAISREFTPFFFGDGYDSCIILIIVLAPVLIIKAMSQTSRMQYLIPHRKEKIFIQSVFIGATVNMLVNAFLIPWIGALGAVVGTLMAELVTCLWQYCMMKKCLKFGNTLIKSTIYLVFGVIMYINVRLIANAIISFVSSTLIILFIEIVLGGITYGVLCLFYWRITKNMIFTSLLNRVKQKF